MAEAQRLAREYELVYILRPTVAPSEARKVADRITDVVQKRGAKLVRVDNWGKRKLAYPIRKMTRGIFVYVKLVGFTDVVAELERNLRNLDDVVRYQTVRLEDVEDAGALEVDPEEVLFREIETSSEEEEEPTFEERLGMSSRRRAMVEEEEAEAPATDDEDTAEEKPEGDDSEPAAAPDEEDEE
jgi:small subunit ribosomal protein S6